MQCVRIRILRRVFRQHSSQPAQAARDDMSYIRKGCNCELVMIAHDAQCLCCPIWNFELRLRWELCVATGSCSLSESVTLATMTSKIPKTEQRTT